MKTIPLWRGQGGGDLQVEAQIEYYQRIAVAGLMPGTESLYRLRKVAHIMLALPAICTSYFAYGQTAGIQTSKTSFGLNFPYSHQPEFKSQTSGMPPYVPLFPGLEMAVATERALAYRWNYSYGLSLGFQPLIYSLDVPYYELDSSRTDESMLHHWVFSFSSPYIQPAIHVNRLYEGMNEFVFSFDLGIKAKVYLPLKEERRYSYNADSLYETMIFESSVDYSFSNSFFVIGDMGFSVWKMLKNGSSTVFSLSYSFPFFDNEVGAYTYLPGTRAHSYGSIATSADCFSVGIKYLMAGKSK